MRNLHALKRTYKHTYTYTVYTYAHTLSVFSLSTQHPTPMLRAWPPLLLASNSGHYITVSVDHQGTAPGHSALVAPSSELLCGPAQSLNYGQAKRGILLRGDVPICWPLQKTDRYKWPKFWLEIGHSSVILTLQKPGGFGAHWHTHTHHTLSPFPALWVSNHTLSQLHVQSNGITTSTHVKYSNRMFKCMISAKSFYFPDVVYGHFLRYLNVIS